MYGLYYKKNYPVLSSLTILRLSIEFLFFSINIVILTKELLLDFFNESHDLCHCSLRGLIVGFFIALVAKTIKQYNYPDFDCKLKL